MSFDQCEHEKRTLIISFGKYLNPNEKNVTKLYTDACVALGIIPGVFTSRDADHLPSPGESAISHPESPLISVCPKCGERTYVLEGICQKCKDSEGGKYKARKKCYKCGEQEKFEDHLVTVLDRLGISYGNQSKNSLGIRTLTDEGLK
ncbi:MAG: hypothetical protein EHM49_04395 [Deltaproteobacteria bacterium]|nr:MAG: hypothetical protein EHM49_04395 [Deltaproteobacteria bacterium]